MLALPENNLCSRRFRRSGNLCHRADSEFMFRFSRFTSCAKDHIEYKIIGHREILQKPDEGDRR